MTRSVCFKSSSRFGFIFPYVIAPPAFGGVATYGKPSPVYKIASLLSGLAKTSYFSFQLTGKTTYTNFVQFGVPNVILDPFGM